MIKKRVNLRRTYRGRDIHIFSLMLLMLIDNLHRLYHIMIKNFKILIRSKSSAAIIILGPLVLMILIAVAFNSVATYDISVGVYSDSYSELSEQMLTNLQEDNYFVKKAASQDECTEGVKKSDFNICLVMSPDIQIAEGKDNKITFFVDPSRINLVYAVMGSVSSSLAETSHNVSLGLTQDILTQLNNAKKELAGKGDMLNLALTRNTEMGDNIYTTSIELDKIDLVFNLEDIGWEEFEDKYERVYAYFSDEGIPLNSSGMFDLDLAFVGLRNNLSRYVNESDHLEDQIGVAQEQMQGLTKNLKNEKSIIMQVKESVNTITTGIDTVKITDAQDIVTPIDTEVQPVSTEDTNLSKLFPTFLTLVIMFVCIMLGSTLVINEKLNNASFRNFITPTKDGIFIFGTFLTSLIIVFIQFAIIFLATAYFLSGAMLAGLMVSLYPLLVMSAVFILIGIIIGYLFNSQETSMLAALFIVTLTLILSNTLLPLESISSGLMGFLSLNPFVLAEGTFRNLIIFGLDFSSVTTKVGGLWLYVLIFTVLSYLSVKWYKKKSIK